MSLARLHPAAPALLVIGASLVARIATWFSRDFNHDEFYLAYLGWIRSTGARPMVDFRVPNFTPLAELMSPLFGAFPESFAPLFVGRALTLVVMVALLVLPYLIARALGASREWALVAVALITCHADFVKRAADVRSDGFSAALLLGAALLLIRATDATRTRSEVAAALLYGAGIALSYKFLLALPFFAIALLATEHQRIGRSLRFIAVAAVPGSVYLAWRLVTDGREVFEWLVLMILQSRNFPSGAKFIWIERSLAQNAVGYLVLLTGVVFLLAGRGSRAAKLYTACGCGFVAFYLVVNPMIFPYSALVIVPLLAPAVTGLGHALPRGSRAEVTALVVLPLAFALGSLPANVDTIVRTNDAQRRVVGWLWSTTAESARAFDWTGMHFGRRGIPEWHHPDIYQTAYTEGRWPSMADQWRRGEVEVVLETYRLLQLHERDARFLATRYVKIDHCLLVPGRLLLPRDWRAGVATFEAVAPGRYRIAPAVDGLTIDGRAVRDHVFLTPGVHKVAVPGPSPDRLLIVHWPRERDAIPNPCPADEPLLYGFE